MVGVRHGIGDLSPSHAILDGHLVRRAADHGRFHRAAARRHVPEHRRTHFLLLVPPAAPRAQAHQRQHDDRDGRHRRADRDAQHFAVDLALRPVERSGTPATRMIGKQRNRTGNTAPYMHEQYTYVLALQG